MNPASSYLQPASHEASGNLIFTEYGLMPYSVIHNVSHGQDCDNPVTGTFTYNNTRYMAGMKPKGSGLTWDTPESESNTVEEFVLQIEPAPIGETTPEMDLGVGSFLISPRWSEIGSLKDSPNPSTPDIVGVNVEFHGSNLPLKAYPHLLRQGMSAIGVNSTYFEKIHPYSNITQYAKYVRVDRKRTESVYGLNGPLRRIFEHVGLVNEDDYSRLTRDNRGVKGKYHDVIIDSAGASALQSGHTLGKKYKHYHPKHPRSDPSDTLYHPKIEVSYIKKYTDGEASWLSNGGSVRWYNRDELEREVEEALLNLLSWSGLPTRADSEVYVPDAVFNAHETERTRTLVDDPTPEIRRGQEAVVPRTLMSATESDLEVMHVMADGGNTHSPESLSNETGWSVRTIYRVLNRLSDVLRNESGTVRFASDYLAGAVRDAVGDALDKLAAEAKTSGRESSTSAFTRWKNHYGVEVIDDSARLVFRFGRLLRNRNGVLREGFFAWIKAGRGEFRYKNALFRFREDGYPQTQVGFDPHH